MLSLHYFRIFPTSEPPYQYIWSQTAPTVSLSGAPIDTAQTAIITSTLTPTITSIDTSLSPYTALLTDTAIIGNTINGTITVNLPDVTTYKNTSYFITNDGSNPITITPFTGQTISSSPSYTLPVSSVLYLYPGTTDWSIYTQIIPKTSSDITKFKSLANDSGIEVPNQTRTIIHVKPSSPSLNQFTSISAALLSITNSSATNPYAVHIAPGIYIEPELTIPTYTNLIGESINSVIIEPDAPTHNIINMGTNTEVSFLTVRNAGPNFAGFSCVNVGDFGQLHKIAVQSCDIGIYCLASTINTNMFLEYVEIDDIFTYGVKIESQNGFQMLTTLESFFTFPIANPGLIAQIYASGSNYEIEFYSGDLDGLGTETGIYATGAGTISATGCLVSSCLNGLYFDNGANIVLTGVNFNNCQVGVLCGANGATPNITSSGVLYDNCTRDTQINNLSCTGQIIGIINYNKIHINSTTPIKINTVTNNVITVAKSGGYFTTISNAISAISIQYPSISLTTSSTTATSPSGLFSPIMTSYQITGTGIPANTTVTYINDNTIQLSSPATQTTTSTLTLLRSNATTNFTITIGPGTFAEPPLVLPDFVNLKGIDLVSTKITAINSSNTHVVQMGTSSTLQAITFDGTAIKNIANRSTVICTGALGLSAMNNCIIANSNVGLEINASTSNIVQFSVQTLVFIDCFQSILVDATIATNGSHTLNVNIGTVLSSYKTIVPTTCITIKGPLGFVVINNFQAIGTSPTNGTAFDISDSANCVISSVYLKNWNYGFINSSSGSGSSIQISNSTITACTRHLEINNDATTGFFTGNLTVGQSFVSDLSTFYIADVKKSILTVATKGAEFPTITGALNFINPTISISITTSSTTATSNGAFFKNLNNAQITASSGIAPNTTITYVDDSTITLSLPATATQTMDAKFTVSSLTNQYIISIAPGVYVEPPIILDNYVSLIGSGTAITILTSATVTGPFITMGESSTLDSINIYGIAGPGGIGVLASPSATRCFLLNSAITYCETCIKSSNPTQPQELFMKGCGIVGPFTNAFYAQSNTGNKMTIYYSQAYHQIFNANPDVIYCTGSDIDIKVLASIFVYEGFPYTGIKIEDGATCNVNDCYFYTPDIAIHDTNVGAAKTLIVDDCVFETSTTGDIQSDHPTTIGSISTSGDIAKVQITSSLLTLIYSSNTGSGDISMIGTLNLGKTQNTITNISDLIFDVPIMGLLNGGDISISSGLQINITAGFGYCGSGTIPNRTIKKITWPATTAFTLVASTTLYIYYTFAGTLSTSSSKPSPTDNIILGRVRTSVSTIEFIDSTPIKSLHSGNNLETYIRDVFGSIFATGSIVTANSSLQLAISLGRYYLGGDVYNPMGQSSPATFTSYFHSSGTFTFTPNVTTVDNTQYDNSTNLTALSASNYVKHSIYLVGESTNERYFLVYGQAQYPILADAQSAPLASPPPYFSEGIVIIASIIVQQGNATFSEITSQRPLPSFNASALSSTLNHGSLLGLLNDDHPQYLLTDGTRALTGSLDLGTNNIINTTTVNGVTVQSHASRHLPNGADALSTAAPQTIIGSTTTNLTGTNNSFSRSDHTHAVSLSSFEINQLSATVPLSVAKGGTGAATLAAGNFLTGNGTNQIVSTKIAPVGTVIGSTDTQTLTNKTVTDPSNIISAFLRGGNITVVDTVNGNDSTASINGLPFKTITAALAIAPSGSTIWLYPGTYNENSLVIPSGVCMRGVNLKNCIISSTVTTSTTLLTVGDDCRIEDLTLSLTGNTNASITLQGILFPSTTASTTKIRTCTVTLSSTSNNNVTLYGIRSNGTATPSSFGSISVRACTITTTASSATSGSAYCLYVDSASGIYMSETNCTSIGGTGISSYGVVTNNAGAVARLRSGFTGGSTGDYLISAGNIDFSAVQLSSSSTIFSKDANQLVLKKAGMSTTINAQATADRVINLPDISDTLASRNSVDTFTNKSLSNSTTSFVDPTTASKSIKFDTSGASASSTLTLAGIQTTNRTITLFDANDRIVGRTTSDTLTNKTLTAPVIATIVNTGTLTLPTKTSTIAAENNNTIRVEKGGNDTTGSRGGSPFLTITAALSATGITSGDIIKVAVGTYSSETFPLVIPSGITLIADDNVNTIISAAAVTTSTTMIQMGTSTLLSGFNLSMTSTTTGLTLIGISFPSTTATTARINGTIISISNTVAGSVTVQGISSTGTGVAPDSVTSITNCLINCSATSATSGTVRGVIVSSASTIRMFRTIINATTGAGANGTGVETSNSSAVFTLIDGVSTLSNLIKATTSALFQTAGTINIPLNRGEYGNGSDGVATLDGSTTFNTFSSLAGSTYTLTRDAYISTLTLDANITLVTNGYRLFVKNALIMNNGSNINNNGINASGITPGGATNTASLGNGTAGGIGKTASAIGGAGTAQTDALTSNTGGSGGATNSRLGGVGGTMSIVAAAFGGIQCMNALSNAIRGVVLGGAAVATINGGSGGGGGGCNGSGPTSGGGGGGAGPIIVSARLIMITGSASITSNGGAGANAFNAGNAGGGGGGGGGVLVVISNTDTSLLPTLTISAAGGTPGTGLGTGASGSTGGLGVVIALVH